MTDDIVKACRGKELLTRHHPLSAVEVLELNGILTDEGAVNAKLPSCNDCSLLHIAAMFENVGAVIKILNAGGDATLEDSTGDLPIHLTTNLEIVRHLVERYSPINYTCSVGLTPLHIAVARKSYATIEYLLKVGANSNVPGGRDNLTAKQLAIDMGKGWILEIFRLHDQTVVVNGETKPGMTVKGNGRRFSTPRPKSSS